MSYWSKDQIVKFIELYKSNKCLWKINSKDYRNNDLREKAYSEMIQFVQEFDSSANQKTVSKQINNLRSQFRREFKKVESSTASGADEEDVYKPKLWYYPLMMFLSRHEMFVPESETSNTISTHQLTPSLSHLEDDEVYIWNPSIDQNLNSGEVEEDFACKQEAQSPTRSPSHAVDVLTAGNSTNNPKAVKRKNKDQLIGFPMVQDKYLKIFEDDESDLYARTVAFKLRKLTPRQRFFAEKLINDVLYEAGLEQLSRVSYVVANSQKDPGRECSGSRSSS